MTPQVPLFSLPPDAKARLDMLARHRSQPHRSSLSSESEASRSGNGTDPDDARLDLNASGESYGT